MKTKYLFVSDYSTNNIVVHKQYAVVLSQVRAADASKLCE